MDQGIVILSCDMPVLMVCMLSQHQPMPFAKAPSSPALVMYAYDPCWRQLPVLEAALQYCSTVSLGLRGHVCDRQRR